MDDQTRTAITAAAIGAVGPADQFETTNAYWAEVQSVAFDIVNAAGEKGRIGKQLDLLAEARCYLANQVISVTKEESSKRLIVELRVTPTKYSKDGVDRIRTERLDDWNLDESVRLLGHKAKSLIGRAALVWVRNEEMANGEGKAKVLMNIVDAGEARTGTDL